jgi:RNA polymerase sigma factor (sigma-70 family)
VSDEAEALVAALYREEGRSLVRLARLFVDDVDAAEDLVQEAFIRLARHAHHVRPEKAPAYLRSIVLNLARDHNRRGLVSLRHQLTAGREVDVPDEAAERLVADERQAAVLEAVRRLPVRQRDCVVLRYFQDLGIEDIAATLGVSPNSVKTHLKRALAHLGDRLAAAP